MHPCRRHPHAGFTLLEMLIAVAVFALVVLALLNLVGESTRTAAVVEERVLAAIVAGNRAVEQRRIVLLLGFRARQIDPHGRPFAGFAIDGHMPS